MIKCIHDLEILAHVWILCNLKLSVPCTRLLTCGDIPLDHSTNHLQNTWHFVSDLQWRGVSIQYSYLRTLLNIDTSLHCKSDTNYHLFCKYNLDGIQGHHKTEYCDNVNFESKSNCQYMYHIRHLYAIDRMLSNTVLISPKKTFWQIRCNDSLKILELIV